MPLWLQIAGATVAFFLGLLKMYEFVAQRRLRVDLAATLNTNPAVGNALTLLNASSVPVNIYFYDLVWVSPGPLGRRVPIGWSAEPKYVLGGDTCNITIAPHSQHSLTFRDGDHFSWWEESKSQDLYLKLWVVGRRRPIWLWLEGPGS